jgi:chemotaxis protein CheD
MIRQFNSKLNRDVVLINIGEFYATPRAEGIGTLVGSCITTCIYEKGGNVGGMNHFLIPGDFRDEEIFISPSARIGMFAIELLMGELIKLNVDRDRLCAKIFGGGAVLSGHASVGENNIRFIRTLLSMEQIPIVSEDLGGNWARKVLFFPENGRVMIKRIPMTAAGSLSTEESRYLKRVEAQL